MIASAEVARNCRKKPVWVLGGAEATHTDFYATIDDPWFPEEGQSVRRTAEIAFGHAGVTREDIDVGGLYDCFTVTMLRDLEELGFCKIGEGPDYFAEGKRWVGVQLRRIEKMRPDLRAELGATSGGSPE